MIKYEWSMKNDYPTDKHNLTVFSCFACGGGSTMGYKLAGYNVLGCCEIDPKIIKIYQKNHISLESKKYWKNLRIICISL